MLEFWGMQSTPSFSLLLGPLLLGVVAPERILSMGQIELNCVRIDNVLCVSGSFMMFVISKHSKLH